MKVREQTRINEYINFIIKSSVINNFISDFIETARKEIGNELPSKYSSHECILRQMELLIRLSENNKLEDHLEYFFAEYSKNSQTNNEFLIIEELSKKFNIHRRLLIKYISSFTSHLESALPIIMEIIDNFQFLETWIMKRTYNLSKELDASRERQIQEFNIFIDNLPQKAWAYDPNNRKLFYNRRWSEYTGLPQEDIFEGVYGISAIHPDDEKEFQIIIDNALDKNQGFEFYCRLKGINNDYRWNLLRGVPIKDETGKTTFWTGTYTDIHDRYLKNLTLIKNSEEKIEDLAGQVKDLSYLTNDQSNFIYMASHDLKAPLSNIQSLVEILKDNLKGVDSETLSVLNMIDLSLSRFRNTLHEISQIVNNQGSMEEVSFQSLIKEIEQNLLFQIKEAQASIHADFKVVPSVKAPKKNLYTIFVNLISNSIKYRSFDRKPEIIIRSDIRDKILTLTFKDNASGMDLTKKDVFKKGERLHTDIEGTGVGLFLVKNIVENMGGKISVDSEAGKGSIFKIFLPFQ